MKKFYLLTIFASLLFASCKTASKAYEKGDYNSAIDLAIKKLQKDPNDGETKTLLKDAYRFAVNQHEDQIRILSNTTTDLRFEKMYAEYTMLQNLYTTINRYPTASAVVKPADYSNYVQTYADKAAAVHEQKGQAWMDAGDKKSYREAYNEFITALRFHPDDTELKQERDDAYNAALVRVVVMPMDRFNNYYFTSNAYKVRSFQDDIIRNLNYYTNNNFVAFYTEAQARASQVAPDEILEMHLTNMTIGQPFEERSSREVSKDVVSKETVYKKDSVIKEYSKVKAKIVTSKTTIASDALLNITSRDAQGRILWSDNFKGEHRWQTEAVTYQGDERALSENDKNLLNKKPATRPDNEEVMSILLKQIQDNVLYRIRGFYQRYS